jgi:hypothetical protein
VVVEVVLVSAAFAVLIGLGVWLWRSRSEPPEEPVAVARPWEVIVRDARRYSALVHQPPRGTSYAKHLAACCVYDRVLGEACAALELEHLLTVLPPGEELDAERVRIETALWLAGLRLEDAA